MSNNDDVLVYDIETRTYGKPDREKDKFRIFGCYSYKTNKPYLITDIDKVKNVIDKHRFLVGFNNNGTRMEPGYDNPILERHGVSFKFKKIIDLMAIFKQRAGGMKIKEGMLKDLLMEYRLDYITKLLGLVDEEDGKKEIDYKMFQKETWTDEERKEIMSYTLRDIEITKKLYDWIEDYFEGFKPFLHQKDVDKKEHLTTSLARFTYKAICKAMMWEEEYGGHTDDSPAISGGYVAYPAGERFEGDIYCLDFNCLIKGTKIRCLTKGGFGYFKTIEKIKEGQKIMSDNNEVGYVDMIKEQNYDDDIIEIELENGKIISCTPHHMIPIYRNNKRIDVKAEDILKTDELITSQTKRGEKNANFQNAKIEKICECCGKKFKGFKSEEKIKSCGKKKCTNKLRSINNGKTNLGKTKYDTPHLMKMSLERIGKKRSLEHRKKIAEANRISTQQNNYNNGKYKYKNVIFKSKNELNVAKALDRDNIKWKYEPKVFTIGNIVYTPDFYLPELDKWLEVKGETIIDTKRSSYTKFKQFFKKYKNSVLIQPNQINELKVILNGQN